MKLQCKKCKLVNVYNDMHLTFDFQQSEVENRKMGEEITYSAKSEYKCSECGNKIFVEANIYEYPKGAYNSKDFVVNNGVMLEEPDLTKYIDKVINI